MGIPSRLIALEKAGIMKSGVPCVIGYQTKNAIEAGVMDIFQQTATDLSTASPLLQYGAEWCIEPTQQGVRFKVKNETYDLPKTNLEGIHQIYNMGVALVAYRVITDMPLDAEILSPALGQISWAGRLQTLKNRALKKITSS